MKTGSNVPGISQGYETRGTRPIFWSKVDQAYVLSAVVSPGFGNIPAGTIMAENNSSGGNNGKLVPYVPTDPTIVDGFAAVGKTFAIADVGNGVNYCYVLKDDSYRFVVGDELILMYNNSGTAVYFDGGAITAIDTTSDPTRAKITFTNNTASAAFTVAAKTAMYVKSGVTTKFNKAATVLDQNIYTGYGADAAGAQTSVVVGNAALMYSFMKEGNVDAQSITDLGARVYKTLFILP